MFIFPMTFIANTFVVIDGLPGPLRVFAEWNPVSAVAQGVREAFGNTGSLPEPHAWPLANPVAYTIISAAVIMAIFVPLAVRQYRKATSR
jgi:ABC-2 type transport system permease protein